MAKASLGPHVTAISGTIGGITYVALHGQQVLRRQARPARKRTPGQDRQPDAIRRAAAYWREVKADPAKLAVYAALPQVPGLGLYQQAVRDFCHGPVVEEMDLAAYCGRPGDPVRIRATDDTAVKQVRVRILDMDGCLVEEGTALREAERKQWVYFAQIQVAAGRTISVEATVMDHPGNTASKSCLAYVPGGSAAAG